MRFEAIKFGWFLFIWRRLKFDAMKFDFARYGANSSADKFLGKANLRKIILDKGRLSDKRIKLKSFVKFKMKW